MIPIGGQTPRLRDKIGNRRFQRNSPWLVAAVFVLPYFLLMMCWAISNPPGAAPDEPDHMVKALGMSRLDIGTKYTGPALGGGGLGMQRNASISRVILVPTNLAPLNYTCTAFKPERTAACQVKKPFKSTALQPWVDTLGSYPPFLYVPMGLVASLADTPADSFVLTRVFCAIACSLLLLLGAAHLVRWLGRRALLGAFIGVTPMVVFCGAIVTTSGFEIFSAFAVACVVIVGSRRRESLREIGTQLLLAGVGSTLILSRQLGVVTFGLLMVILVIRVGWPYFWALIRRPRWPLAATAILLGLSTAMVTYWERTYDHPSLTGPVLSSGALDKFGPMSWGTLKTAVNGFGWVDTFVPTWMVVVWIVLCVLLIGLAVMWGSAADKLTLVAWLVALVVICYTTYATVFYTIGSSVQGRHMLAFFMLLPLLSGVVVAERMHGLVLRSVFLLVAITMPAFQAFSFYVNARRYAVGTRGPIWFADAAGWYPPGGWIPWLVLGAAGAIALAGTILWTGRPPPRRGRPADDEYENLPSGPSLTHIS